MKTSYGELPLVVDPTTGRARLVRGQGQPVSGPRHTVTGSGGGFDSRGAAPSPTAAVEQFDSKLEARRNRHLSMLVLAGDVKRFKYHPFTIPIGPGKKYTPDFLVEYADRVIVIEEVKGHLKMKNARDSITRLHVAAGLLPMFTWRLVIGEGMDERVIA